MAKVGRCAVSGFPLLSRSFPVVSPTTILPIVVFVPWRAVDPAEAASFSIQPARVARFTSCDSVVPGVTTAGGRVV